MRKHVSHRGPTDKANQKQFQKRIRTPTANILNHGTIIWNYSSLLKHNKSKLRYTNERDQRIKNKAF